jgi:predicted transcriptional regulator
MGRSRIEMTIDLPPAVAQDIELLMHYEKYQSPLAVIRDALAALRREKDLQGIREGIADMEAGRFRPWEEVDAEIRAKFGFGKRKAPPKN